MPAAELTLTFASQEDLAREHEANLQHGRAFVPGAAGLALFAPCTLRLARADTGASIVLEGRVVMVSDRPPMRGIAVELGPAPFRDVLAAFVTAPPPAEEAAPEEEEEPDGEGGAHGLSERTQERQRHLRQLGPAERARVAQGTRLEDRVLLERIYGSAVWEAILRGPHVTPPEVARIARKGSLPRPLVDLIVDNANWIRQDIVRRALLTNPRVSPEGILKILRATPPRELKLIAHQTAYPPQVRAAARKLAGG